MYVYIFDKPSFQAARKVLMHKSELQLQLSSLRSSSSLMYETQNYLRDRERQERSANIKNRFLVFCEVQFSISRAFDLWKLNYLVANKKPSFTKYSVFKFLPSKILNTR